MPDRPLNRICYVEDDEDIQRIVRMSLERLGKMTVHIVGDPTMAIDAMNSFKPDLVMLDIATVTFVEVRYRRNSAFGGGAVSVDAGKRRRIALAAQSWLGDNRKFAKAACRFDVVAVDGKPDALQSEWIRAAFTLDDLAG